MPIEDLSSTPTPLGQILKDRIVSQGPIPFSDFMTECLYHPQFGYYMTDRKRIGRDGDFFTSSSVHAIFGRLIAKQLHQMWEILGSPATFILAEQGAGEGHLCLDILDSLESSFPDFYNIVEYCLVEISPEWQLRQATLLVRHTHHLRWCQRDDLKNMVGCFLSNELIDAFPVHLVEMHKGRLQEVFVTHSGDSFQELLQEPSNPELEKYLRWVDVELAEGNRAEINLGAPCLINDVANLLQRGFILTIDYGNTADVLYAPWRREGTLMCYYQHTADDNPYVRIGEQDLTAHVDFTALIKSGEAAGLQTHFYGDQCKFLLGLGFVDALLMEQSRESDPVRAQSLRLTLKNLILPDGGMGEIFKVLVQGKGVGEEQLLCSRSLRDLPLPLMTM